MKSIADEGVVTTPGGVDIGLGVEILRFALSLAATFVILVLRKSVLLFSLLF